MVKTNLADQLQIDVARMLDDPAGAAPRGPSQQTAVCAAGTLGFVVVALECLHFRLRVDYDGGGPRAWATLILSFAGVVALVAQAPRQPGAAAMQLMAALMLAHVFVPLVLGPPAFTDDDDDDASEGSR